MRILIIFILTPLLLTMGFVSCSPFDVLLDTPGRRMYESTVIDLYIPDDVQLLDGNELSILREEGEMRIVRWYFRGFINPEKIVNEYIDKMQTQHGWKLDHRKMENKSTVIVFKKVKPGGKVDVCTITVMIRGVYTIIKAEIYPSK